MGRAIRRLQIGWLSPVIGTFGAVREMIELSNTMVRNGVRVTIYHPGGGDCQWLPCAARVSSLEQVNRCSCDVLIGIVDWKTELYELLVSSNARHKAICLLGFTPTSKMAETLKGPQKSEDKALAMMQDAMRRNYTFLADSSWQVDWFQKEVGYPSGPAFGGINLTMFNPTGKRVNEIPRIIYSNDPRDRKGTDTVRAAIEQIKQKAEKEIVFDSYWNRGLTQEQLVDFYRSGDVFLDGHRRAGWCNPVAEAVACQAVPVCTDIGAVRDFAIHEETALVVPVDDAEAMATAALRLLTDTGLRQRLARQGWQRIQRYSYEIVGKELERSLRSLTEREA